MSAGAFLELADPASGVHAWLGTGLPGLQQGQGLLVAFEGERVLAAGTTGGATLELRPEGIAARAELDGFGLSAEVDCPAEPVGAGAAAGTVRVGDRERELNATAVFGALPDAYDSVPGLLRMLSVLPGEGGTGLTAVSARHADGPAHDAEMLQAWLLAASEPTRRVDEPLLSTQYDESGAQARAGLELWVGQGDQMPLRIPGVRSVDTHLQLGEGWGLRAALFHWVLDGAEAQGSYLIWRHSDT